MCSELIVSEKFLILGGIQRNIIINVPNLT